METFVLDSEEPMSPPVCTWYRISCIQVVPVVATEVSKDCVFAFNLVYCKEHPLARELVSVNLPNGK